MCTSAPMAFKCRTFSVDILSGYHQHHPITLGAADQRQAQAGVAGGGFDDGATRLQAAITFGGVNHCQTDAVLDRATGVLRFEFEKQRARPGIKAGHAHQRGIADQPQHGRAGVF